MYDDAEAPLVRTVTFIALAAGVALIVASIGLGMRDRGAKQRSADQELSSKAADEATNLEEYFLRARSIMHHREESIAQAASRTCGTSRCRKPGLSALPSPSSRSPESRDRSPRASALRRSPRTRESRPCSCEAPTAPPNLAKSRGRNRVETLDTTDPEPVELALA